MQERYQQNLQTAKAQAGVQADEGLRAYMLKVYNYMASGVLLTGIIALFTANSPAILSVLYGPTGYTGLGWVVALSPLGFVIAMSFGLHKMKASTLQILFWAFAGVMGLSLSSIFLLYTGLSIAKIFFITALISF